MGLGATARRQILVSWPRCIYHSLGRQPLTVEHVIPKYWLRELYGAHFAGQPAVDDVLHLFPAGRRANSERGHQGLHFVTGCFINHRSVAQKTVPVTVPDASKGVLARSLQLMMVKYPEIQDILPMVLVPELYEEWLERPVCAAEIRRWAQQKQQQQADIIS